VICTKVGHADRGGDRPAESVSIAAEAENDWHSIAPSFVEEEVRACRERLGTAPDFVLLHNPEYLLSTRLRERVPIAAAWDEMYDRLFQAFRVLEKLCHEGEIATGYGVSSNFLSCVFSTTGRKNLYEALVLDRVIDAAAAATHGGGAQHRMRLVQLPLNALESGALLGRGEAVSEAAEGDLVIAERLGMAAVTNRPLNAIPPPGMQHGDWGSSSSHLRLKDKKPMGTSELLLKRVILEALSSEGVASEELDGASLQRLALRLAFSAQGNDCCLCGMRSERYVEDAAAAMQLPHVPASAVVRSFSQVRRALEEMGVDRRGFW